MSTAMPYGSWPSPITPDLLVGGSVRLGTPQFDPVTGELWWTERRAEENCESLWRLRDGQRERVTGTDLDVRATVHEYGGGAWSVVDGRCAFTDARSGAVQLLAPGEPLRTLTAADPALRHADLRLLPDAGLVLAVREDHRGGGEPVTTLVALPLTGEGEAITLASGADFYAAPAVSAGGRLAWMEWDHPNMPWDDTRVVSAPLADLLIGTAQPQVHADGGANIYPTWRGETLIWAEEGSGSWAWPGAVTEGEAGHGMWVFGHPVAGWVGQDQLAVIVTDQGTSRLEVLDLAAGTTTVVDTDLVGAQAIATAPGRIAGVFEFADRPEALQVVDLGSGETTTVVESAQAPEGPISIAEPVSWQGPAGTVHGFFYPPVGGTAIEGGTTPDEERPPLITLTHGGPTSHRSPGYSLAIQFWTSRGIAVLDVNYSGSTGHGREYRERLQGRWGVLDLADVAAGATAMAEQGRVDPGRLAIMGGSAGGYTTLSALTGSEVFSAGISLYGIGDLAMLATDTHKFESRYLDGLVGPWPAAEEIYAERSPLLHVDRISCPMLLLQGADDKVVPPNQAESMAAAVQAAGQRVALTIYPGEGHGFRGAAAVRHSLLVRLAFLGAVFGFTPADEVPAIDWRE